MENFLNLIDHTGKIVVITGVSGQLGQELRRQYISNGAYVVGIDSNSGNESVENSQNYSFLNIDIRDYEAIQESFRQISIEIGPIHALINNAGTATFEHYTNRIDKDIDIMMDVNLKGTFNCIKAFALTTSANLNNRSIINVGSIYGLVSPDFRIYDFGDRRSSEIYGATKAGLIQISKYFAVELAPIGIRVNTISPGGIFNPNEPQAPEFVKRYSLKTPLNRMAKTAEIANAFLFLTSDAATYITGHNLIVDGGYTAI